MEEQHDVVNESKSSIEELKMNEDENLKEIALEDEILGTQSLLMSESDEDVADDLNLKKGKSPQKKRHKRLLDSDEELDSKDAQDQSNDEENRMSNKKKISALIDSDSDEDEDNFKDENTESIAKLKLDGENDAQNNWKNLKTEIAITKSNDNLKKKNAKQRANAVKIANQKEPKSELYPNLDNMENNAKVTKKYNSVVDTDSSDDESSAETLVADLQASAQEAKTEENNNEKTKTSKVVRASAKRAMDEMQAIQSEQQRLHREAHISIPYHKPRKHTLDEFLKRRTIIQPQNANAVAAVIQTRSLKMTTEELEEYAKLMEERAKEATEFFKSESENEEEEVEVFKDNKGVLDNPAATAEENIADTFQQSLDLQNENELLIATETEYQNNMIKDTLNENRDGVQLTEDDLKEILAGDEMSQVEEEQERPTPSKVLITEIIELPKLDMTTVRISPVKKLTPRSSLNVKQLLAEKVLSESPSLSGDPNKLIDLETGDLIEKNATGMDNLMKRLMATIKAKKVKQPETCNILSIENGKLEISKVNIARSEVKDPQKETKPGAAYFELKKSLKEIITKKRLEEINKKQDDELEYSKCLAEEDSEEEDEIEEVLEEEYEPDEKPDSNVASVDEGEKDLSVKGHDEEYVEKEMVVEEEDEEDGNEEDSGEDEEDADEEDAGEDKDNNHCTQPADKSQRKSRIITAFDDSDEEGKNDDIDFLKTQPATTQPSLLETQSSIKTYLQDEENELLTLCSGTFEDTKKPSVNALMSQIPITQNSGKPLNDDELMALCSGTFDKPLVTQQQTELQDVSNSPKMKCNKILSSDEGGDEEPNNMNGEKTQKIKKLTKRQKKRKAKLGFSDDEDDEENKFEDVEGDEELTDDNFEPAAEEPETFIDYDSEENEILVKMTNDDKVKQAQNFFENEAELSESEWGSADEDEHNLDTYDIELGDEDEFDREKIRTELGQIHARKMLDEDIREVRKIQELLFEDEEKDGVGRQRTFKWKNAESGFSLEDGKPFDEGDDNQNGESGDEINEHQWRKIRYEREQFLKEQGLKPDSQEMTSVLAHTSVPFNTVSAADTFKKLQIITAKKTTISTLDTKKGSPFLISKGVATMHKKSIRGSFLTRDKETLNKLAGLTKGTSSSVAVSDMDDTAATVSVKCVRPTNFVFATLTNEEHENMKRKADDVLNSSNENGKDYMKKPKMEPRRDKCFIDQLL